MRIELVLFEGFDEVDAIAPFEVLVNAGHDVALVGAAGPAEVLAGHGARLTVAEPIGRPELLLVPGGGWNQPPATGRGGARAAAQDAALLGELRRVAAGGAVVGSVCTGALVLAAAGLVEGRPATTHHSAFADLRAAGALLDEEARVVDDGDLVTCGGGTSGLDLALHLVERFGDRAAADRVAAEMEHERRGPVRITAAG